MASLLVIVPLLGAVLAVFGFTIGVIPALSERWIYSKPYSGAYAQFVVDRLVLLGLCTIGAGVALGLLGYLGYRALVPSGRRIPSGRRTGPRRNVALLGAVIATLLLLAAAALYYVPLLQTSISLSDADFPQSIPGAFNSTYRISTPVHEPAGVFLDGTFHVRWNNSPDYERTYAAEIMELDKNGSRILPSEFLVGYQVPRTGDYVVVMRVPACPFDYPSVLCDAYTASPPQVYGTVVATDTVTLPAIQLGLGLAGATSLAVGVAAELWGRRKSRTPSESDARNA